MQMYCGNASPSGSSTVDVTSARSAVGHPVQQIAQRLVVEELAHINHLDIYQLVDKPEA